MTNKERSGIRSRPKSLCFADQTDRTLMLGIILICSALSAVTVFVLIRYFAVDALTSLLVTDPHDCVVTGLPRIGLHCFSDYYIPVEYGLRANAWDPYPLGLPSAAGHPAINNYPPTGMLPHLTFGIIGWLLHTPMVGLVGYVVALTAAVLAPAFWAARGAQGLETIIVFIACGVAAIPAWATVDQGNSVGFFVPLGLVFLVALRRERWGLAAVAVVVAAMIKPQFVLLAVVFFAARKWKLGFTTAGFAVLFNFAGYLLWPRDFPHTVTQSFHGVVGYVGDVPLLSNVNVALPNAILAIPYAIAAVMRGERPPGFPSIVHTLTGLGFLAFVVISLVVLGRRVPPLMAGVVLFATASLVPSVSNRYYLIFALPIAALVARDPGGAPGTGLFDRFQKLDIYRRNVGRWVSISAALSIAQIAIPAPSSTYGTPQLDGTFASIHFVPSTAMLTPMLWLVTCIIIIVTYWRHPVPDDHIEKTKEPAVQRD